MFDVSKLKVRDKVKIVANTTNHNFPIGSTGTISSVSPGLWNVNVNGTVKHAYAADLGPAVLSRTDIQEEIEEAQSVIDKAKTKLAYLDDTGDETFDDLNFKIYHTLKTVSDNSISLKDKTDKVAALFK